MSIMGGYDAFPVQGILAALGIVLSAMYLLYMLAGLSSARSRGRPTRRWGTPGRMEMAAAVPLAVLLVLFGVFPALLISVQRPGVEAVLSAIGGS
jgi:NADH-quinone oxidoreductase subunit M